MQYRFVMFQTQAVSPITFRFRISMQAKIIQTSSCSEKSGKTGKNALSVTGGQRAVTLCAGVAGTFFFLQFANYIMTKAQSVKRNGVVRFHGPNCQP